VLATGFGAGRAPVAPGTFGALEGLGLFILINWASRSVGLSHLTQAVSLTVLNAVTFMVGVLASNRVCRTLKQKDPSQVVIDEVNGQMIALTPLVFSMSWPGVVVGFVLFRLFDIVKPYPIRELERLPEGIGVMSDDVLAGIYGAVLLWLLCYLRVI